MKAWPDQYLEATQTAKDKIRKTVAGLPRMETPLTEQLSREDQQKMFDNRIKPLLLTHQTDKVLEWVARNAPPGTDPGKELFRLIKQFGGEK